MPRRCQKVGFWPVFDPTYGPAPALSSLPIRATVRCKNRANPTLGVEVVAPPVYSFVQNRWVHPAFTPSRANDSRTPFCSLWEGTASRAIDRASRARRGPRPWRSSKFRPVGLHFTVVSDQRVYGPTPFDELRDHHAADKWTRRSHHEHFHLSIPINEGFPEPRRYNSSVRY